MPSRANFAGNGFGRLPDSLVVFAGTAILTGNGFRRLSDMLVVLADAAAFTGNGFGRLSNLIVVSIVLAGAAIVASGNVVVYCRPILSNWARITHCRC